MAQIKYDAQRKLFLCRNNQEGPDASKSYYVIKTWCKFHHIVFGILFINGFLCFVLLLACLLHVLAKQCNFIQVYFCNHVKFKIGLKINLTIKLNC